MTSLCTHEWRRATFASMFPSWARCSLSTLLFLQLPAATAGALLRQARQAQGMHIAVLAAAIKVSQRKLEALEGDRLDELPDATFTRALAQTVCRTLKIDPAPVLALLELLKDDASLYVRRSVANNLNDIGKDHPALLIEVAQRWLQDASQPGPEPAPSAVS